MEVKREPVVPEPECPVCGEMPHEEVEDGEADE